MQLCQNIADYFSHVCTSNKSVVTLYACVFVCVCPGEESWGVQLWTARSDQGGGASLHGGQQDYKVPVWTPLWKLLNTLPPSAAFVCEWTLLRSLRAHCKKKSKKSEAALTARVLTKHQATHKRSKRMPFDLTTQDKMQFLGKIAIGNLHLVL